MGISLRDYQIDAVNKMKNGCILCGGVGSGKSRTALAYYYIRNDGVIDDSSEYIPMGDPPKDLYIITTARKRDTLEWEGELSPFLLSTKQDINSYHNKVVIDSWNNIKKYADKEYPIILEMKNNENMIQIDFENQKNTKKEYVKGTGIGIQNIKNMMEQMKGESEIINNENRYAIVLSFPIYIE